MKKSKIFRVLPSRIRDDESMTECSEPQIKEDRSVGVRSLVRPKASKKSVPSAHDYTFKFHTGCVHSDFREQLNQMRKQAVLCDLAVGCGGTMLAVHRLVLAIGCPFLRHHMDQLSDEQLLLQLNDIDGESLAALLDFMYTGKFKALKYLDVSKLQGVNHLARQLGLVEVDVCSEKVLRQCLAPKNFLHVWDLADAMGNRKMKKEVVSYIVDNLDSLWITADLMALSEDRMLHLLAATYATNESQQNVVLRMLMAWLKHDPLQRKGAIDTLVPFIRMAEISEAYARYLLQFEPYVQECQRFKEELNRNIVYHSLHQNSSLSKDGPRANVVVVDCHDGLVNAAWSKCKISNAVTACPSNLSIKSVSCSSPVTSHISSKKNQVKRKVAVDVLAEHLDADVQSIWESSTSCNLGSNEKSIINYPYNCSPKTIRVASQMNIMDPVQTVTETALVVIGHNGVNCRLGLLAYSFHEGKWYDLSELGLTSAPKETILVNKSIVCVVGGEEEGRKAKMRSVFISNLSTKTVRRLPDLHIPRSSPCLFMMGSMLYVVGGEGRYTDALSQVEYVDIKEDPPTWRNWPPMRHRRQANAVSCYVQGMVVVVGGGTNKCEYIQPDLKEWRELPPLPEEFSQMTPHLVTLHGTAAVFNYYHPSRFYFLDMINQTWRSEIIKGTPPTWVISATSWNEQVFALDKSHKIFKYEPVSKRWAVETKMPRSSLQPSHLAVCEISD